MENSNKHVLRPENEIKYKAVVSCVDEIYHHAIEDNFGFGVCSGLVKQETSIDVTNAEAKRFFLKYFEKETGVPPFEKCPLCGEPTILKKKYEYFVGCSGWPKCKFSASKSRKYTSNAEYFERAEKEAQKIEYARILMNKEGKKLLNWIYFHNKFSTSEKALINQCKRKDFVFTYGQAEKVLTIYIKAEKLGYPNIHEISFDDLKSNNI